MICRGRHSSNQRQWLDEERERADYREGSCNSLWMEAGAKGLKHSYNAKFDVAIIIGKETGKLLHVGVRNKYCLACARQIP